MSEPARTGSPRIRWYAAVLVLAQATLLGLGARSLWVIAGGWWIGAVAAASFTVVAAVGWAVLLVPGSRRRLPFRDRLTTLLLAGTGVVVAASLADVWIPALAALSTAVLCDSLDQRARTRPAPSPRLDLDEPLA